MGLYRLVLYSHWFFIYIRRKVEPRTGDCEADPGNPVGYRYDIIVRTEIERTRFSFELLGLRFTLLAHSLDGRIPLRSPQGMEYWDTWCRMDTVLNRGCEWYSNRVDIGRCNS